MFTPIGLFYVAQSQNSLSTLLNNSNLRALPADVTQSVSSAELDNNASGNRLPRTKTMPRKAGGPETGTNTQTEFLTQLASGDISGEVNSILLQYEKLLSYANVKYKPSNAGKPNENEKLYAAFLLMEKYGAKFMAPETEKPDAGEILENIKLGKPVQPLAQEYIPAQVKTAKYTRTAARNSNNIPTDLEIA